MPAKKYIVDLTPEERQTLEQLTSKGKAPVYKINHARILLKADINSTQGEWTDRAISQALDISPAIIERVRQRFVEPGPRDGVEPLGAAKTQAPATGWGTRSAFACDVVWSNTRRPRTLDFTFVSRADGGVGLCGERFP